MATIKRDFPLSPTPAPTTPVKATADSSAYYNNLSKKFFDKGNEVINAPYGGRPLKEQFKERSDKENEYNRKAFEATNNALRQHRKGKPGYDKMGFPLKKP